MYAFYVNDNVDYHIQLLTVDFISVLVVKKKKKNDQPSKRVTIRAPELANYTCEICGYQSTLEGVRKHRVREHSTKHVYCEICDSPFSSRYEMRKHRKKHFYLDGTQTEELKTLSESKPELKNIMLQDVEIKYPKLLPFKCIPFSGELLLAILMLSNIVFLGFFH